MPLEVKAGPAQVVIHQRYSVFITDPDGQVGWPYDKGLCVFDTRLISAYSI